MSDTRRTNGWIAVALVLLTAAVYWPVCRFGFVNFDDDHYVYANPVVRAGISAPALKYACTAVFGNWNPLLWLSFLADVSVFGVRPGLMHVENVVLHAITGLLLWRLLATLTGRGGLSAVVAAVFLVHPMHVESVAWISERKDVLSTPLLLIAIGCYVRYVWSSDPIRWYGLMLAAYSLSLLVKPMGVTLAGVLILIDYWPLSRRITVRTVIEKLPLLAVAVADVVATVIAQGASHAIGSDRVTAVDRVDNAVVCYVLYVVKLIVPTDLCVFYPHPMTRPAAAVFAAAVLLVVVTVAVVRYRRRAPWAFVGWFWFIGTLVPVIGFIRVGGQAMADRYSYLPSVGIFVAVVWAAAPLGRRVGRTAASAVVIVFAVVAHRQVLTWKDSETLFTRAEQVTEGNWQSALVLGLLARDRHDLPTAVKWFELACDRNPYDGRPLNQLGLCWLNDDPHAAANYFEKATEVDASSADYHANLGIAYLRIDRRADAEVQLRRALELDPSEPTARSAVQYLHDHR